MLAAFMLVGELVVVQAEGVEDGGVEVAEVDFSFDRAGAGFVRGSVGVAAFKAAASQPEGEPAVVVAGFVFAIVGREARAAEFASPDDQRIFQ